MPKFEVIDDQQLEVGIPKIGTIVQELRRKITYLEVRVVPTTPLEEIEKIKSSL